MAQQLGVREETVTLWEHGLARPLARHYGRIVRFLGYDPEPGDRSLAGRLRAIRRRLGLTQEQMATRLGQDEKQICRWEKGTRRPHPWIAMRIDLALRALDGQPVGPTEQLSFFDLTRWRRAIPAELGIRPSTPGEKLRARRLEHGLSMTALARKVGVSRGVIYRLERDHLRLTPTLERKLRRALDCAGPQLC